MAINSSFSVFSKNDCSICLEEITENEKHKFVITSCNHVYHETCLTNWIERPEARIKECPMCRCKPIPFTRFSDIENADDDDDDHLYIESSIVKAVRTNNIVKVIDMLKLTPLSLEKSSKKEDLEDITTQNARSAAFSKMHRDTALSCWGSLISIAARRGHKDMVLRMLDAGANIDEKDKNGTTPLMHALDRGHIKLALSLIEFGADLHVCTKNGISTAYMAAKSGSLEILKIIIESGEDINVNTNNGYGLMHAAAMNGHNEILSYLYNNTLPINAQTTNFGLTPLHQAVISEQPAAVEQLLLLRADTATKAIYNKQNPLHDAVLSGNIEICTLLLDHNADINQRTEDHKTPLMVATEEKNIAMIQLLLDRGADKTLRRFDFTFLFLPYTPADLAYRQGETELYELLR